MTSIRSNQKQIALDIKLYPKQLMLLQSKARQILYGGAAGGGKSAAARFLAIVYSAAIPGLNSWFLRRYSDDLTLNHIEGPTGFRALLAPWIAAKWCEIVDGEIRFKWGSRIFLRSCQYERDLPRLLGPEIHCLFIEEAGQFSENMIRFIRARLRIPDALKIPDEYAGMFPRAIYTSNPGGVGHNFLKRMFVQGKEPFKIYQDSDADGGMLSQYIPAKLADNPSINREEYERSLRGLGSKALVDSLLDGNWDSIVGAYFPELDKKLHLIKPFLIPDYWPRGMSMDWGACGEGDPFAIGWWATSDGSVPGIPRGAEICYRSFYGAGLPKTTVNYVANEIRIRETGEKVIDRVAGGDIMEKRGTGPSIFEIFQSYGIHFRRADMRRVSGWQQCRERFVGVHEQPLIYFFDTMMAEFETMQSLQHDKNDRNDAMAGNDHWADMVRYRCMARPWVRNAPPSAKPIEEIFAPPTLDQMWARRDVESRTR